MRGEIKGNKPRTVFDIYCHITPTEYKEVILKIMPPDSFLYGQMLSRPQGWDVAERARLTDVEGYVQVLSSASAAHTLAGPEKAVSLARLANDGLAELVAKYPARFVAAIATLPMNNIEAALRETDRCIVELGFKGILLHTPCMGKPLDSTEFLPIYEKMAGYGLPIWIHPQRDETHPYYPGESQVKYRENVTFGWPFETSLAMNRLVYSGIMAKFPDLKFIIHHGGAMVPFFESRIPPKLDRPSEESQYATLNRPPIEYFKAFYVDTAGLTSPALECSYRFFGADRIVFGTDFPYADIRQSIGMIEKLASHTEQAKIFEDNCRALLHLS